MYNIVAYNNIHVGKAKCLQSELYKDLEHITYWQQSCLIISSLLDIELSC